MLAPIHVSDYRVTVIADRPPAHVTLVCIGVKMLYVTAPTSAFRKLRSVSTFATPWVHLSFAAISGGGTKPATNEYCHSLVDHGRRGGAPVTTVTW